MVCLQLDGPGLSHGLCARSACQAASQTCGLHSCLSQHLFPHALPPTRFLAAALLQAEQLQQAIRDKLRRLAPQKRKVQQEVLLERSLGQQVRRCLSLGPAQLPCGAVEPGASSMAASFHASAAAVAGCAGGAAPWLSPPLWPGSFAFACWLSLVAAQVTGLAPLPSACHALTPLQCSEFQLMDWRRMRRPLPGSNPKAFEPPMQPTALLMQQAAVRAQRAAMAARADKLRQQRAYLERQQREQQQWEQQQQQQAQQQQQQRQEEEQPAAGRREPSCRAPGAGGTLVPGRFHRPCFYLSTPLLSCLPSPSRLIGG